MFLKHLNYNSPAISTKKWPNQIEQRLEEGDDDNDEPTTDQYENRKKIFL